MVTYGLVLIYTPHSYLAEVSKVQGWVRIIGGEWRGRKLKVPKVLNLRPTPDRVRETVFNWLAPMIAGAYCLDAFSGSGALGFEALSRGAAHAVMVDNVLAVTQLLVEEASQFKTTRAEIYCAQMPVQLKKPQQLFDLVFLDPPYEANLLLPCCFHLEQSGFLAPKAHIYLESRDELDEQMLPSNWRLIKSKRAGQVLYQLALRLA